MNLYKRGKQWYADYYVDGKRYRQAIHTESKAIAEAWVRQIDIARQMPTFEEAVQVLRMFYKKPDEGVVTLDIAWKTYEDLAKATGKDTIATKTFMTRRSNFNRFLAWVKKNQPSVRTVEGVTGPVAAKYATYLVNQGLKSKTRINTISELGTVWKLLQNAVVGISNPWASLRPQDTDGERGKPFSLEQERIVLEAAKKVGKSWFEISTIMRHTALRYEDVALMTWDDIQGDVIRIQPRKTKRREIGVGIPVIGPVKKVLDSIPKVGKVLFPMHEKLYGENSHRYRVLNFKEVLVEAGLDGQKFSVHTWRHTACSRLAAAGADIELRKSLLGHTVDATARRYDHDEHLDSKRLALERAAALSE